jgi:hypothetical protein
MRRRTKIPQARWAALKPAHALAGPAHVFQVEDHALDVWTIFVPVVVPAHIEELCSEERPVDVVALPLVAVGMARAKRPECRVWLMRKAAGIVLILNGRDAEEMIELVSELDGGRAVQLHEELASAEWVDVREDEELRRAQAQWALFGGVGR